MVRYKICSMVEGTNKIVNLKLNGTCKNMQAIGKPLFLISEFWLVITISTIIANINKMKRFMLPKVQILLQIWLLMEGKLKRRKYLSSVVIFHLLKHGKPMIDFEHMKGLFDFVNVHHTPRKYWTNSSG